MSSMVTSDTDRDAVEDVESTESGSTAKSGRPRFGLREPLSRSNTLLAIAGVLLLVCAGAAVWFGVSWQRAPGGADVEFSQQRDEVTRVAENTIITLNTVNYKQIDKSFDDIVNTMTADAQKDFLANKDKWKSLLVQGKVVSKAEIAADHGRKAIAVEDLNTHDGTASVMVVVIVTVTPEGGQTTSPRERYILHMTRTGDGWKTNSFDPVTVYPAGQ